MWVMSLHFMRFTVQPDKRTIERWVKLSHKCLSPSIQMNYIYRVVPGPMCKLYILFMRDLNSVGDF